MGKGNFRKRGVIQRNYRGGEASPGEKSDVGKSESVERGYDVEEVGGTRG